MNSVLKIEDASKTFFSNGKKNRALCNVSIDVAAGERVSLLGASGSEKSTLIRAICGLEVLDKGSGEILIYGRQMQSNGHLPKNVRQMRNEIGTIFQQFNLVNQLDVITNVLIGICPQKSVAEIIFRRFSLEEKAKALDALEKVGLIDFAYQRASNLSGGQQQRVAIARALIKGAKILLADEPVASLDPESSRKVMETMVNLSEKLDLTFITSLHQIPVARKYCERTIALNKGVVVFDGPTKALTADILANLYGSNLDDLDFDDFSSVQELGVSEPKLALVQ
ncbi:phosphonate ABC transporter ATP-binding protein [Polynucleobacter necessarius]|uniref:phosphonate ABC transporter ATP-binding protein n=1 Tax=Polynucleobacter necessarius TaxID=576610 RepID=UPI000E099DF8|nr:phosphonate ABC transporter ATP-binding protein [Polynucleobacter necessarius]